MPSATSKSRFSPAASLAETVLTKNNMKLPTHSSTARKTTRPATLALSNSKRSKENTKILREVSTQTKKPRRKSVNKTSKATKNQKSPDRAERSRVNQQRKSLSGSKRGRAKKSSSVNQFHSPSCKEAQTCTFSVIDSTCQTPFTGDLTRPAEQQLSVLSNGSRSASQCELLPDSNDQPLLSHISSVVEDDDKSAISQSAAHVDPSVVSANNFLAAANTGETAAVVVSERSSFSKSVETWTACETINPTGITSSVCKCTCPLHQQPFPTLITSATSDEASAATAIPTATILLSSSTATVGAANVTRLPLKFKLLNDYILLANPEMDLDDVQPKRSVTFISPASGSGTPPSGSESIILECSEGDPVPQDERLDDDIGQEILAMGDMQPLDKKPSLKASTDELAEAITNPLPVFYRQDVVVGHNQVVPKSEQTPSDLTNTDLSPDLTNTEISEQTASNASGPIISGDQDQTSSPISDQQTNSIVSDKQTGLELDRQHSRVGGARCVGILRYLLQN